MAQKLSWWVLALIVAFGSGCNKSAPPPALPSSPSQGASASAIDPSTIARIHWLGKDRLAADTNAAGLMKIWQTPESARLETQTLEKLSRAPWRLLYGDARATNDANALLQPLLSDLVQAESFLEIRQPTNQPAEIAFAIRLKDDRAKLWESNLAAVLESLTGIKTTKADAGWQLSTINQQLTTNSEVSAIHSQPSTFRLTRLTRSSDWTLVGVGSEKNPLLADFQTRISRDHAPFPASDIKYWLEADLDASRLSKLVLTKWEAPDNLPRVSLNMNGDGETLRTRADLDFPSDLGIKLESWNVPTNLIQSPLVNFTAIRGIGPLLGKLGLFSPLPADARPDQLYIWDLMGLPFKMFFALPAKDSTTVFSTVAPQIQNWLTPHLDANHGSVSIDSGTNSLAWTHLAFGTPFLRAVTNTTPDFLFGGFAPYFATRTNRMPPELLTHVLEGTNSLYIDWELTGEQLAHWRYVDDTTRITFDAAHAPRLGQQTASVAWVANSVTNLGYAITELKLLDQKHMHFSRKSALGLSSLEIDLLINWLEVPQFPMGLHTIFETNSTPRVVKRRANPGSPPPPR